MVYCSVYYIHDCLGSTVIGIATAVLVVSGSMPRSKQMFVWYPNISFGVRMLSKNISV